MDEIDFDLPVLRRLAKLQRPQTAHGVPLTWLETERKVGLTGNSGPSGQLLVGSANRSTTPKKLLNNQHISNRPSTALPDNLSRSMSIEFNDDTTTKSLFNKHGNRGSSGSDRPQSSMDSRDRDRDRDRDRKQFDKSLNSPVRPHTSSGMRNKSPGLRTGNTPATPGVGCGDGKITRSGSGSPTSRRLSNSRPTSPTSMHNTLNTTSMISISTHTHRPISVTHKISVLMAEVELAKQRSKLLPPAVFKKYMDENSYVSVTKTDKHIGSGMVLNQGSVDSMSDFNFFDDDMGDSGSGVYSSRSGSSQEHRSGNWRKRPATSTGSGSGANHLIKIFTNPEGSTSTSTRNKSGNKSVRNEVRSTLRPNTAPGGSNSISNSLSVSVPDRNLDEGSFTSRSALKGGRSMENGGFSARSRDMATVKFNEMEHTRGKGNGKGNGNGKGKSHSKLQLLHVGHEGGNTGRNTPGSSRNSNSNTSPGRRTSTGVAMTTSTDTSPVAARAVDGSDNYKTPPGSPDPNKRTRNQSFCPSPVFRGTDETGIKTGTSPSKHFFPSPGEHGSPTTPGSGRPDLKKKNLSDNDARDEAIRINHDMRTVSMQIVKSIQEIKKKIEKNNNPNINILDSLSEQEKDFYQKYEDYTLNAVFQHLVLLETARSYEDSSDWVTYRDSMDSIHKGDSNLGSRTQDRIYAAKKRRRDMEIAQKRETIDKVNERKRKRMQALQEENKKAVQKQWLLYSRILATAK